jgi:3-oxoacyl-[acyl-carrier protein] reductase
MQLDGQTVLVTGASRGLGRAIALGMAQQGANLVLSSRDGQALNTVAREIERFGRDVLIVRCDVRDPAAVITLAERSLAEFGRIDTVVNSAGVAVRRAFAETTASEWDDLFTTLVRGTMLVTQALLPAMIERKRGNIINLAAPLEQIELPGFAAYTSAKYAVVGLTKTLAKELRRYGINVNGLHPGGFAETDMVRQMLDATRGAATVALLDPSSITTAAVALAREAPRGRTGTIVDAAAWNAERAPAGQ